MYMYMYRCVYMYVSCLLFYCDLPSFPSLSLSLSLSFSGSSSPIDVCSLFNSGQLLLFSAGALSYGVQAEATMFTNDFTWLGQRRVDIAQIRAVLTKRYTVIV